MKTRLQQKDGYWYGIINYKDEIGKYKKKWVATGFTVKGNNKRKAEEFTQKAVQEFESELQNKDSRITNLEKDMSMSELIREWLPLKK